MGMTKPMPSDSVEIPVEEVAFPSLLRFVAHWNSVRGEAFAPTWDEFDVMTLDLTLIPRLVIVDVIPDPLDFVFRFWGQDHFKTKGID